MSDKEKGLWNSSPIQGASDCMAHEEFSMDHMAIVWRLGFNLSHPWFYNINNWIDDTKF